MYALECIKLIIIAFPMRYIRPSIFRLLKNGTSKYDAITR